MTRTDHIDAALHTLDAARAAVDPRSPRARNDLQRILATDRSAVPSHPHGPAAGATGAPQKPRRAGRRVAGAAGLLAATVAGVVAVPALTGGDAAFASWTGAPGELTAAERGEAASSCRDERAQGSDEYGDALDVASPAIAERRGSWTLVVLAGADGFAAMCITDDSSHLFANNSVGSIGTPDDAEPSGPRDLIATDLGTATVDAGDLSLAAGIAGADIVAVTYRSRTHGSVSATVSHGRFALWLPGDELGKTSPTSPVDVQVTYRDGTEHPRTLTLSAPAD